MKSSQVIDSMERETGIEPGTSSLGIQLAFVNKITMIGESPRSMKMTGARSVKRRVEEPGKRAEFVRGAKARK
jgi:hypothetical protein